MQTKMYIILVSEIYWYQEPRHLAYTCPISSFHLCFLTSLRFTVQQLIIMVDREYFQADVDCALQFFGRRRNNKTSPIPHFMTKIVDLPDFGRTTAANLQKLRHMFPTCAQVLQQGERLEHGELAHIILSDFSSNFWWVQYAVFIYDTTSIHFYCDCFLSAESIPDKSAQFSMNSRWE